MDNQKISQEIKIISRKHFEINGVKDVESFDENNVTLQTVCGLLSVDGRELKISVLDIERGVVILDGKIDSVYFSDEKEETKRGFLGRLLR